MMKKYRPLLAAPAALLLGACAGMGNEIPSWGPDLVAVTASNKLITFNHGSPGTLDSSVAISGLQPGENVVGIDYRPADGKLYGLGSSGELYLLDLRSGAATPKARLSTALDGSAFGLSFNPVDGKLRVLSDAGQNLVVDADSGAAQAESGFDSAKVSAVAAAYTTQPNGPFATTLYVINSKGAEISSSIAPSSGKLMTVGAIGSDIGKPAGFDIRGNEAAGVAYAATAAPDASSSKLYLVKLSAGSVKSLGTIGGKEKVSGLAIRPGLDS
ncbi:MAG TPA: DUF4394 domain-containing protein [Nevskia sp.]|nr:DUF4394 domain-containing protein [Nevskia sp.]